MVLHIHYHLLSSGTQCIFSVQIEFFFFHFLDYILEYIYCSMYWVLYIRDNNYHCVGPSLFSIITIFLSVALIFDSSPPKYLYIFYLPLDAMHALFFFSCIMVVWLPFFFVFLKCKQPSPIILFALI